MREWKSLAKALGWALLGTIAGALYCLFWALFKISNYLDDRLKKLCERALDKAVEHGNF